MKVTTAKLNMYRHLPENDHIMQLQETDAAVLIKELEKLDARGAAALEIEEPAARQAALSDVISVRPLSSCPSGGC